MKSLINPAVVAEIGSGEKIEYASKTKGVIMLCQSVSSS
jgi:hypothetical protein